MFLFALLFPCRIKSCLRRIFRFPDNRASLRYFTLLFRGMLVIAVGALGLVDAWTPIRGLLTDA